MRRALPNVILLVGIRARIWIQMVWFQVYTVVQAAGWTKHTSCRETSRMGGLEPNCSLGSSALEWNDTEYVLKPCLTQIQALIRIYCIFMVQVAGRPHLRKLGLLCALKATHWCRSFQAHCESPKQHCGDCQRGLLCSQLLQHSFHYSTAEETRSQMYWRPWMC